jgi:tRNA(Arg) A34 adenosine deaminase TadA
MNPAFMREAIRLSMDHSERGDGGPFGAIVVRRDEIVGAGWNQVTSRADPTAHAEIVAIRAAASRLGTFRLDDCEIYASCEPCPMCLGAIYWARLGRLFYAASRADAAAAGFDDDLFYRELAQPPDQRRLPTVQVLRDEALPVLAAWRTRPDRIRY